MAARLALLVPLALGLAAAASQPGCRPVAEVDGETFECNGVTVRAVYGDGGYVTVECDSPEDGAGAGAGAGDTCKRLPTLNAFHGRMARGVTLKGCPVGTGLLQCAWPALHLSPPAKLRLEAVPGGALATLREHDLMGLPLRMLIVSERGAAATAPFPALAAVPDLLNLTVIGARVGLVAGAFASTPGLERLELVGCGLVELPPGAFRGLAALRHLAVFNNADLVTIGEGAFEGLDALEVLDLSGNGLRAVSAGALRPTSRLRRLALDNVRLSALDAGLVTGLARLEEMSVSWVAALAVGERALADLPALRRLRLTRCGLRALPPDTLANTTALEQLDLSHNRLAHLPPDLLQDQANLVTLNLTDNLLEELPDGSFAGLAAAAAVDVSRNRLRAVGARAFVGAGALRWLSLAHNELTLSAAAAAVGPGQYQAVAGAASPLAPLLRLRHLALQHNRISQLYDDWKLTMTDLRTLDLSHNAFTYLWDIDFNFIQENVTVDLRDNEITNIEETAIGRATRAYVDSGATVLLDGNPVECDCRLYWLAMRERTGAGGARGVRCAGPAALRGVELGAVPPAALRCAIEVPPAGCGGERQPHGRVLRLVCATSPPPAAVARLRADIHADNYTVALRLEAPPPADLALSPLVTDLDLSGLNLTEVPASAAATGLLELDLSSNGLSSVPAALLSAAGPRLRLARNPLACDCGHAEAVSALQLRRAAVVDYVNVTCAGGEALAMKDAGALCDVWRAVGGGLALAVLGVAAAIAAALAYRFRRELKHWLRARGMLSEGEERKPYDAFVSFCHEDHWLVMDGLVAELERGSRPYRLCVHHRDWRGGEWVPAQIARSVRESRRTLVVLSAPYLRSRWALMEFRAALECALRENRVRLVVVVVGDVTGSELLPADVRAYLRVNTYLTWGEPGLLRKLRLALGPPARPPAADKLAGSPLAATWLTPAGVTVEAGAPPPPPPPPP